jgi:hypothetical protein
MILYNVTVKVEPEIASDWLVWMKAEHIPEILETGCFTNALIWNLLEVDEAEGPTYAIQYFAENMEKYALYVKDHAPGFRQKFVEKWDNKCIVFRSVMQAVH